MVKVTQLVNGSVSKNLCSSLQCHFNIQNSKKKNLKKESKGGRPEGLETAQMPHTGSPLFLGRTLKFYFVRTANLGPILGILYKLAWKVQCDSRG